MENDYHTLKFINKLGLAQLPSYLYESIQYKVEVHDCNARNLQRRSVFFEGFKMFNELPAEVKECQNEDILKHF